MQAAYDLWHTERRMRGRSSAFPRGTRRDDHHHLAQTANNKAADKLAELALGFGESGSKMIAAEELLDAEAAQLIEKNGGPCKIRTCDQLVKSQLLYRLS